MVTRTMRAVPLNAGLELVNKWVQRSIALGKQDDLDGTTLIFGDSVFTIKQSANGDYKTEVKQGKVIIFRDYKELLDEYTCRICGTEYNNKRETIQCCTNEDE